MKSSMWLLDPRPDLPTIVRMVEEGFALSEATHAPVMMELRIRACHVTGEFKAKANRRAASPPTTASPSRRASTTPAGASSGIFTQERQKVEERLAGRAAIHPRARSTRSFGGELDDVGIIVLGGLANSVLRALARLGSRRSLRPPQHTDLRAQCRLSARAGGAARGSAPASEPCWWSKKAIPTMSSRRST